MYAAKRHGDWIWGLTNEEAGDLGPFLRSVASALKEATGTTRVYQVGLGENSLHYHGILAASYEPFGKEIQAALATAGEAIADPERADLIASVIKESLSLVNPNGSL
jgi:hypothetical protein